MFVYKIYKILFQNLRNVRENKNERKQTNFGFDNGTKIFKIFYEIELFFIFETKCSLSAIFISHSFQFYSFKIPSKINHRRFKFNNTIIEY